MKITSYREDLRFLSCKKAFLVTGKEEHEEHNREFIQNNQTGYWFLKEGRINNGDLIFVIMPNVERKSYGYPRELYAGIINRIERYPHIQNRVVLTVQNFFQLPSINQNVKEFLCGKTPPQGNNINEIWTEIDDEDDESAFPEGARIREEHQKLERDRNISRKAKEKQLKKTGKLECEVCEFDFKNIYGEHGYGFIEAHHKIPVSELNGIRRTKISDFALVCSNCHRMLHRGTPLLSIQSLKLKINRN